MRLSLDVKQIKEAEDVLRGLGRSVDPVLRGTLNSTGSYARTNEFGPPLRKLFRRKGRVSRGLALKRAGTKRHEARIIAASSGVEVPEYARWGYTPISPTRAVVWVAGLNGHKVAAGFVNPAGSKRAPLRTRSSRKAKVAKLGGAQRDYRYNTARPETALGPSLAYWFQSVVSQGAIKRVNEFMLAEFDRRLNAEINKGASDDAWRRPY
ncbi:MAG: hypothetical protein V7756_04865 [Halopseudomonas sp.]|uniref:hypothetical protein n=1 Tax=Halopseudomonas sp. TaxID=2901191 RepID=UPI00300264F6